MSYGAEDDVVAEAVEPAVPPHGFADIITLLIFLISYLAFSMVKIAITRQKAAESLFRERLYRAAFSILLLIGRVDFLDHLFRVANLSGDEDIMCGVIMSSAYSLTKSEVDPSLTLPILRVLIKYIKEHGTKEQAPFVVDQAIKGATFQLKCAIREEFSD